LACRTGASRAFQKPSAGFVEIRVQDEEERAVTDGNTDFKNSRVFIAGASVAATIGLAILIYEKVLLPTHTLSLQNQIASLSTDNKSFKDKIEPLEVSNKSLKEQVELLLAKVRSLEATNLFVSGNPYPVGLSAVRTGQPISDVDKIFPAETIDKEKVDSYWSVKLSHAVISDATYYFSGDKKIIYQVFFWMRSEVKTTAVQDAAFLAAKLTEALGPPSATPKPGYYVWNVSEKTRVYVRAGRHFLVTDVPTAPRDWPRT
jgi:hypothetical protein